MYKDRYRNFEGEHIPYTYNYSFNLQNKPYLVKQSSPGMSFDYGRDIEIQVDLTAMDNYPNTDLGTDLTVRLQLLNFKYETLLSTDVTLNREHKIDYTISAEELADSNICKGLYFLALFWVITKDCEESLILPVNSPTNYPIEIH